MGPWVVAGVMAYAASLLCVPVGIGRHRHPLLAAHCRAKGVVRGSREEIAALDMLCSATMLVRWLIAAVFVWGDPRLFLAVAGVEGLVAAGWAAQRARFVMHRRARERRRQAAA